jgi:hypothetical protein
MLYELIQQQNSTPPLLKRAAEDSLKKAQWRQHHSSPRTATRVTHFQVGDEAPGILVFVLWCRVDPDEAVVTQNHRGTTWQVMEVSLLPFYQGGRNLDQNPLT